MPYRRKRPELLPQTAEAVNWDDHLARGLVGWWPLHETGGIAVDLVGKHHGSYIGSPPRQANVPPVSRIAPNLNASFTGSNYQLVSIPDAPTLDPQYFTVSVWAQALGNGTQSGGYGTVVSKSFSTPPWTAPYATVLIRYDSNLSAIMFWVGVAGGSFVNYSYPTTSAALLGKPVHLALVCDGANAYPYVNGRQIVLMSLSGSAVSYGSGVPWLLGADYGYVPYGEGFQGLIWDFRLYNRPLTAGEMLTLYSEPTRPALPVRQRRPSVVAGTSVPPPTGMAYMTSASRGGLPGAVVWRTTSRTFVLPLAGVVGEAAAPAPTVGAAQARVMVMA